MLLRAPYILSMTGEPIRDGAVRIADGAIAEVGGDLSAHADEEIIDLPGQVLLPGLVNAHVHLDLSFMGRPLPHIDSFGTWVGQVLQRIDGVTHDDVREGLAVGVQQSLASGVTTVGDYVNNLSMLALLPQTPLSGRAFIELLTSDVTAAKDRIRKAANAMHECQHDNWQCSLTPHAIHTLERSVMTALVEQHQSRPAAPMAIHAAEDRSHWQLLAEKRGPLVEVMQQRGYPPYLRANSPIDYLDRLCGIPQRSCLIHCNYVTDNDIATIRAAECTVVHCPQSHRYFAHEPFPLQRFQKAGVPIALGTDGLPCADSLNMLDEMRLVREKHPHLTACEIVTMATRHGAEALWLEDRGVLAPGKRADLIAVSMHGTDPYEGVLQDHRVGFCMISGKSVQLEPSQMGTIWR
jgi:aminodeoxyfutalosine deaminase